MGLELQTEAAKQIYIDAGNVNWSTLSLPEMDQAMFDILVLMSTSASPSRSVSDQRRKYDLPRTHYNMYRLALSELRSFFVFQLHSTYLYKCPYNILSWDFVLQN